MKDISFVKTINDNLKFCSKAFLSYLFFLIFILIFSQGCFRSSSPEVEELIKIKAPTFSGLNSNTAPGKAMISIPSKKHTLSGECDPQAYLTEYSLDQKDWKEISCSDGKFEIPVFVNGSITVWARSKGKYNYTDSNKIIVRFLLPPTSNAIMDVASAKADSSDELGSGSQAALGSTFEGNVSSSATTKVKTYLPRLVYEKD